MRGGREEVDAVLSTEWRVFASEDFPKVVRAFCSSVKSQPGFGPTITLRGLKRRGVRLSIEEGGLCSSLFTWGCIGPVDNRSNFGIVAHGLSVSLGSQALAPASITWSFIASTTSLDGDALISTPGVVSLRLPSLVSFRAFNFSCTPSPAINPVPSGNDNPSSLLGLFFALSRARGDTERADAGLILGLSAGGNAVPRGIATMSRIRMDDAGNPGDPPP
ncbi:uncharacterized protein EI90DRAFT_3029679 [Cantharellus anzutake]|uniref:uncharacterized protein n=1 Tax=Cantharellus anzutake TaxID=1750568 RepID=UPI001906E0FA|nr:uncharacterized protein EI90DRAFT_3029679 [Cantharellus anzutake]KAF8342628.1 hypothetical protein EI90DRAFT_3029679 [Cantharellus anzutake]